MGVYHVFQQDIALKSEIVQLYETLYQDILTDEIVRYFAVTSECTEDMSAETLQHRIEQAIVEELSIVSDMPNAIEDAKRKGMIHA